MQKPIIAIDIDDVLAASAAGWVAYSNAKWGTHLQADDYDEHWGRMWGVDHEEAKQRAELVYASGVIKTFKHFDEASAVLRKLKQNYRLLIVTSRVTAVHADTLEWINLHFEGLFEGIQLAGLYESKAENSHLLTKLETFQAVGADYVIDDQPKHCLAAAKHGITAVLFGDYPWNRDVPLHKGVTRCRDWPAVGEYFDGQR